jgi:microsomal dipeptidase-like Zn-dependent dipeptidase
VTSEASTLHAQTVVIDGCCPLLLDPAYIDWYREGGITVVATTAGGYEDARMTLPKLAVWSRLESYPPPPYHYPTGIEAPRTYVNLTERQLQRGYSVGDVMKFLGGNCMRVIEAVWG